MYLTHWGTIMQNSKPKDLITVKQPNGDERTSEQMTVSLITLGVSIAAAVFSKVYSFDVSEADVALLSGALVGVAGSVSGLVLRWRSKGGTIKAKEK